MITEVFIPDVLKAVCDAMKVAIPSGYVVPIPPETEVPEFYTINFEPGTNIQILDSLDRMDLKSLGQFKYPLVAAVMPISEKIGSGFSEVTFPRIVIAHLTKTVTDTEIVMEKYSSTGVFKTILRPCLREFMNKFAWSIYTNMGDPDAYEYTVREIPCQQEIGKGLRDFVDIIEILNLKATIFSQIKTC